VTPMSDLGSPVVDGPIPGTGMTAFAPYDLSELGYLEEEYFVSGEALSYELGGDGPWSVSPNERAEYRTRFVVRRPIDSSRFNGTLIVEWLNVSGGTDVEPDWALMHRQIMRDGFAWVGVSAQKVGIEGSGPSDGPHLKSQSPERYGTLKHPGDAYSYDMFSQVGRLVGASSEGGPLGPLAVERLIASGHSQSAAFLVTYVNAIDPLARVYDGYLVHGRGASGAQVDGARPSPRATDDSSASPPPPIPSPIRDDSRVPVLTLQSETDVVGLGGGLARQPDSDRFRLWEVAGAAHAETYLLAATNLDTGKLSPEELASLLDSTEGLDRFPTEVPINSGPQSHYVGHAALAGLDRWVRGAGPPPEAARLELNETGDGFVLDDNGNARGGVRTPWVDVPTAALSGLGQNGADFAFLFGTTRRFDAAMLGELYPGGRDEYLRRFDESLVAAITRGFILDVDAQEIRGLAAADYPGRG
jgi:hypothetical protein